MAKSKKNIGLYILKILKEYSDDKHPISQTDIIEKLKQYGVESIDRGTIARNIDMLQEFGFSIVRKIGGGCYLINETFDSSELTFIVDCIFSSPAISQKQAESIIERITENVCVYDKQRFKNIFKSEELIRTDNRQVFFNIDQINLAIQQDKQISFTYNRYGKNKQLIPRKNEEYIINPYFMINSKGKYFLVCNKDNYSVLSNYRIDYITNIKLLDAKRKSITCIENYNQELTPVKYANEHVYMFSGETKNCVIRLSSEKLINDIIDWFGKNIKINEIANQIFVEIRTNENALIYWALQYGENVEIVEPLSAREKIKQMISAMMKKYN